MSLSLVFTILIWINAVFYVFALSLFALMRVYIIKTDGDYKGFFSLDVNSISNLLTLILGVNISSFVISKSSVSGSRKIDLEESREKYFSMKELFIMWRIHFVV